MPNPVAAMKVQITDNIPYSRARRGYTLEKVLYILGIDAKDYDNIDLVMEALRQLISEGIFEFGRNQNMFVVKRIYAA